MKTGLASVGSVGATALAHLPCCGINIALAVGGAGSGLGFLAALEPYRPVFIAFSLVMAAVTLALAFRPHKKCAHSECHHNDRPNLAWRRGAAIAVSVLAVGSIFLAPKSHEGHPHDAQVVLHE
jgi:mercuric ion transport protein